MKDSRKEFNSLGEEDYFNILAEELEYEWKTSRPHLTEKQLIEIFSPPRKMISLKLAEWEEKRLEAIQHLKTALRDIYRIETDAFSHWFGAYMIRLFLQPEFDEYSRQIKRLKRILSILTPETAMGTRTDAVERARTYPIYEMAQGSLQLKKVGSKYLSLCPFHNEIHASCYLYPETNTFHCFGCQEHGDVIKLTMHLHGASFPEAVAMLQR